MIFISIRPKKMYLRIWFCINHLFELLVRIITNNSKTTKPNLILNHCLSLSIHLEEPEKLSSNGIALAKLLVMQATDLKKY